MTSRTVEKEASRGDYALHVEANDVEAAHMEVASGAGHRVHGHKFAGMDTAGHLGGPGQLVDEGSGHHGKMRWAGEDARETNQDEVGNVAERSITFAGEDARDHFGHAAPAQLPFGAAASRPVPKPAPRWDKPTKALPQDTGAHIKPVVSEYRQADTMRAPGLGIAIDNVDRQRAARHEAAARPGELDNRRDEVPNLEMHDPLAARAKVR
jgi:hypothetical protein